MATINQDRIRQLLAAQRKIQKDKLAPKIATEQETKQLNQTAASSQALGMGGNAIEYNKEQQEFITRVTNGESVVLVGAAGTGKTTCQRGAITQLIQSGKIPFLADETHKVLRKGTPGILIVSFTRRAVSNIAKNLPADIRSNAITIHKALEYEPVYYEVNGKNTMAFEPARNRVTPLDSNIRVVIVEESSMVSVELFNNLKAALPQDIQWIFLGDIQQLPPVMGDAILGYKMLELPVIELTQVYRQAMESPIIRLAHRILSGVPIKKEELPDWKFPNQLTLHPFKKKVKADPACLAMAGFIKQLYDNGTYNPDEDGILIPFNEAFGTKEINAHIANHIAKQQGKLVHEIVAGFEKLYFSVGDRVLVEKEDAIILSIEPNLTYVGKAFQLPSKYLDYWGMNINSGRDSANNNRSMRSFSDDDIDAILASVADADDDERKRQGSHVVKVQFVNSGLVRDISSAGDLNKMLLAYSITVHKSQGSEWRKVFVFLHNSHATMIQRELLYTAVTRAKEELYVVCEEDTFEKGIISQRIKGNTIAEKAEHFKGKLEERI